MHVLLGGFVQLERKRHYAVQWERLILFWESPKCLIASFVKPESIVLKGA